MTKAYSKISGYDRPHVYVFVSDKKISTLESVFKNFRIRPENTLDTVWTQAVFVKKKFAFSQISGYVWTTPYTLQTPGRKIVKGFFFLFSYKNNRLTFD